MDDRPVREGMRVYSVDGHYLGTVEAVGDTHFLIEKGLVIPHEYMADYKDITGGDRHEVHLNRRLSELEQMREEHYRGIDTSAEPVNEPT